MQCKSVKFQLGKIEFLNENSEGISAIWRGTETRSFFQWRNKRNISSYQNLNY